MAARRDVTNYAVTWTYVTNNETTSWTASTTISSDITFKGGTGHSRVTITANAPDGMPVIGPPSQTITVPSAVQHTPSIASGSDTAPNATNPIDSQTITGTGISTASSPTGQSVSSSIQPVATTTIILSSSAIPRNSSTFASTSSAMVAHRKPSSATIAGTAIGCAIAGAVLAGIVARLLIRRHRRRSSLFNRTTSMLEESRSTGQDAPDTMEMALTKIHTDSTLEDQVPAPIQSQDLANAMRGIGNAIKNHAHSYYGSSDALSTGSAAQLSSLLGTNLPVTTKALLPLLSNPLYKVKSIRFLMAWSILPDKVNSPERTLLPPELVRCMSAMRVSCSEETSRSALLAKWRQLSSALMQSAYDSNNMDQDDSRWPNILQLVDALDAVLEPLASRRTNDERCSDLEKIVKRAAQLEYMMFASSPAEWGYDWKHVNTKPGELVVFPGLRQSEDGQVQLRMEPQVLTQPQVVSMGRTNLQA